MARIRAHHRAERTQLTITGALTAADMGRLEHACAAALTRHPMVLDIDLRRVTAIDRTADAVLRHLHERGAQITLPLSSTPPRDPKSGGTKAPPAVG